jgi:phosphate transport system substrate-binding protein
LYRTVYIISREARAGLGSGFTAFVAGDKGQRIILKSGLVPATAPIRIVEINN